MANEQEVYRLLDLLNGGKGIALGKAAEQEGLDSNLNSTFRKDVFIDLDFDASADMIPADGIVGGIDLELIVDSGANAGNNASFGEDKELFNAIRRNGWFNDVIAE